MALSRPTDLSLAAAPGRLRRAAQRLYGGVAVACQGFALLYGLGFVGNLLVPRSVDSGVPWAVGAPLLFDLVLLAGALVVFGLTARPRFRRPLDVGPANAAATARLLRAATLATTFLLWQPLHGLVWHLYSPTAYWLDAAFGAGASLLLITALRTGAASRMASAGFALGLLLVLWATPTMSSGHLLLSLAVSATLAWLPLRPVDSPPVGTPR